MIRTQEQEMNHTLLSILAVQLAFHAGFAKEKQAMWKTRVQRWQQRIARRVKPTFSTKRAHHSRGYRLAQAAV